MSAGEPNRNLVSLMDVEKLKSLAQDLMQRYYGKASVMDILDAIYTFFPQLFDQWAKMRGIRK